MKIGSLSTTLLVLLIASYSIAQQNPIVNTTNGQVRGKIINLDRNYTEVNSSNPNITYRINAWLGIPFAEKPIGDLRFKRPVPVKNWSNVKDTLDWPNMCVQNPFPFGTISEDCLYLNIWSPNPLPASSPVPVMVIVINSLTNASLQ